MKSKKINKKVSQIDMIIEFLEKDLNVMKQVDQTQISLFDIESILTQSLNRVNRFKKK